MTKISRTLTNYIRDDIRAQIMKASFTEKEKALLEKRADDEEYGGLEAEKANAALIAAAPEMVRLLKEQAEDHKSQLELNANLIIIMREQATKIERYEEALKKIEAISANRSVGDNIDTIIEARTIARKALNKAGTA